MSTGEMMVNVNLDRYFELMDYMGFSEDTAPLKAELDARGFSGQTSFYREVAGDGQMLIGSATPGRYLRFTERGELIEDATQTNITNTSPVLSRFFIAGLFGEEELLGKLDKFEKVLCQGILSARGCYVIGKGGCDFAGVDRAMDGVEVLWGKEMKAAAAEARKKQESAEAGRGSSSWFDRQPDRDYWDRWDRWEREAARAVARAESGQRKHKSKHKHRVKWWEMFKHTRPSCPTVSARAGSRQQGAHTTSRAALSAQHAANPAVQHAAPPTVAHPQVLAKSARGNGAGERPGAKKIMGFLKDRENLARPSLDRVWVKTPVPEKTRPMAEVTRPPSEHAHAVRDIMKTREKLAPHVDRTVSRPGIERARPDVDPGYSRGDTHTRPTRDPGYSRGDTHTRPTRDPGYAKLDPPSTSGGSTQSGSTGTDRKPGFTRAFGIEFKPSNSGGSDKPSSKGSSSSGSSGSGSSSKSDRPSRSGIWGGFGKRH